MQDFIELLKARGIQPTTQRLAVASRILDEHTHPSADQVWERVQADFPTISRATVYNTLNLFVEHGLLRKQVLREGIVVFDPTVDAHHHFVDVDTGEIHDIPWNALEVKKLDSLRDFEVEDVQVILRGRKKKRS
jgi:Fur family iron response transcriptional regulator